MKITSIELIWGIAALLMILNGIIRIGNIIESTLFFILGVLCFINLNVMKGGENGTHK